MINYCIAACLKLCLVAGNAILIPFVLIGACAARFAKKKVDVGIGPVPMINNVHWAKALKEKGYTVETFVNAVYFITQEFDYRYDKGWRKIYQNFPILFTLRCGFRYKIVYFYFNGGPMQILFGLWKLEPYILRLAGVKIVVMPYGSDCQLFEFTPNKMMPNELCKDYPAVFQKSHNKTQKQVRLWTKMSNVVIGAMDSIDYMFFWNKVRHCHFAIDTEHIAPVIKEPGDKIVIFHAPNHTNIKGTKYITEAVEKLQGGGYNVDLVMLQGQPNETIIKQIQESDIVIDQLVIGWYGMFAMEAMACGKPTVCYLREDLTTFYEMAGCVEKDEIPLISASVLTIYDVLKELVSRPEKLTQIGLKSRSFIDKYHSYDIVGNYFAQINKELGV